MWKHLGRCVAIALLSVAASGCVTTPSSVRSARATSVNQKGLVSQSLCAACTDQRREIERLRQELSNRDAEIRELRSDQRVQVKVLQESKREVSRAKVKLRRVATRADAASYIAEVEVAMDALRRSVRAPSSVRRVAQAQQLLDSTAAPFAQGDYSAAMDHAAEAERLIALASEDRRQPSLARRKATAPLRAAIGSKVTIADKARKPASG